jgi:hypothetical protein
MFTEIRLALWVALVAATAVALTLAAPASSRSAEGVNDVDVPVCGDPNINTNTAVDCAGIVPVPSLEGDVPTVSELRRLRTLSASRRAQTLPPYCRLQLEAVLYTSSDWVRLAQRLAGDASPCADYYISIPPLAADKTALRCLQDDLVRATSPQVHPMAEAATNGGWNLWVKPLPGGGFAPGRSWFDAGVEMRHRMALCGYLPDELWAVNEVHSGVRRNNGNSRPNWLSFMRGLYYGPFGSKPVRGLVFVIGFDQSSTSVADYKPQMEEWLQDEAFWTEFRKYVRFFAQEVYGDVRRWGVNEASRNERTGKLNDFLMHPLNLARAAPEGAAVAREYLEASYVALANAAWPWDKGFGNTKVSIDEMRRFVSEQLYAMRHFAGSNPQGAPSGRVGAAYAPFNTCGGLPCIPTAEFAALAGLLLDRLASGLHHAYDRGGSSPPGACGPPGDQVWCDAFVDGAAFTDLWDLFNVWGAVR